MDIEQLVVSIIFLLWGGIAVLMPEKILQFRTWTTKKIYGADFKPSKRTVQIERFLGIVFIMFGIFLLIKIAV